MMNYTIRRAMMSILALSVLGLSACSESTTKATETTKTESADTATVSNFEGCYAIEQGSPALIKISKDGTGYAMQMKENADKAQAWDEPEMLDSLSTDDAWQYFASNSLNLNKSDLIGDAIVRKDKVMAMAQVQSAAANTNPFLDSAYVVMLINKVATIYQVLCDDTRVDMIKDFHHATPSTTPSASQDSTQSK
ncbi:hypothetical protein [uncultured Moraxella sp.]|uniref:hypothetical protein n=1 Tax=uncultured Moraxella sp. TaxID=263769 RepID=UPI0025DD9A16|nr:hypothetical protein [uncultured Moraxella sp.]